MHHVVHPIRVDERSASHLSRRDEQAWHVHRSRSCAALSSTIATITVSGESSTSGTIRDTLSLVRRAWARCCKAFCGYLVHWHGEMPHTSLMVKQRLNESAACVLRGSLNIDPGLLLRHGAKTWYRRHMTRT
jgi:hypothetical protein